MYCCITLTEMFYDMYYNPNIKKIIIMDPTHFSLQSNYNTHPIKGAMTKLDGWMGCMDCGMIEDRWMDGLMDWWMAGCTDEWNAWIVDRWVDGLMDWWMAGLASEWNVWIVDRWVDGLLDWWMDGWTGEWNVWIVDRWVDGLIWNDE